MTKPIVKKKEIQIDERWKILKNEFVDLEPDNDFPIGDVFDHFDEDILCVEYKDYMIDVGFYGDYHTNRDGFFKLEVTKGDFWKGVHFEIFISRSTDEIRDKLDFYLENIPLGVLDNVSGLVRDENYDFENFQVYSAINKVSYRLTEEQIDEMFKPKK